MSPTAPIREPDPDRLGDLESLVERRRFFCRLAQRLVADAHLAEDATQDAFVAAIESSDGVRGALAGWFTGVVKNLASSLRRSEARRAARQFRAMQGARVETSTDTLAERLERQRLLERAVLQLDEPYRGMILLRYLEGMKPAAIARREGIPVATVNSRLTRAHAILRRRLDQQFGGDRAAWMAALLPLQQATAPAGALAWILGVSILKKLLIGSIAAAVLVTGTVFWHSLRSDAPDLRAGPVAQDRQRPASDESTASTGGGDPTDTATRDTAALPAIDRLSGIHGVVRDLTGAPIEGAAVDAFGSGPTGEASEATALSSADGSFFLPWTANESGRLLARKDEYVPAGRSPVWRGCSVGIVLEPGLAIDGMARDGVTLAPLSGVSIHARTGGDTETAAVTTGDDGRFRLFARAGLAKVVARRSDCFDSTVFVSLPRSAQETVFVDMQHESREPDTYYRVVAAGSGLPVDRVVIDPGPTIAVEDHLVRARARLGFRGRRAIVTAPGFAGQDADFSAEVGGDPSNPVVVELQPGASLRARALESGGAPAAHAHCVISALQIALWEVRSIECETDADGWVATSELLPGRTYGIRVTQGNRGSVDATFKSPAAGATIALHDLQLRPTAPLEGRVVVAGSETPIAGARVQSGASRAITDESGAFALEAAERSVTAQADGFLRASRFVRDGSEPPFVVELERGVGLGGSVVDAAGIPLANARVTARLVAADEPREHHVLETEYGPVWSGVDGRFAFDGLYAGRYELSASRDPLKTGQPITAATGRTDTVLHLAAPALLYGRAVAARDGLPVPDLKIQVKGSRAALSTEAHDGGGFYCAEFAIDEPDTVDLAAWAPGFAKTPLRGIVLTPGQAVRADFVLEAACVLEGVARYPDGVPVAGLTVYLDTPAAAVVWNTQIKICDSAGRFVFDELMAETDYSLRAYAFGPVEGGAKAMTWHDVTPTTVRLGTSERRKLELTVERARGTRLEGIVTIDSASKVSSASLWAAPTQGTTTPGSYQSTVAEDGRYVFPALPRGTYKLTYALQTESEFGYSSQSHGDVEPAEIEVDGEGVRRVDLKIRVRE